MAALKFQNAMDGRLLRSLLLNRPGFPEGSNLWEDWSMNTKKRYSPGVRERPVRMVREHRSEHVSQWEAITSIARKIGCTAESLRRWVRQSERDAGERPGLSTEERDIGLTVELGCTTSGHVG